MGAFGLWMVASGSGSEDMPWWWTIPFWAVWFGILVFAGYRQGTAAREIVVHGDDQIEFVGLWHRVMVPATEILSIRVSAGEVSEVIIEHGAGSVHLAGPFDGFHQFVTEIKLANPAIRLSGC